MEEKYLYMIRKAQEFMNENHFADVSRVQCLLRKMMSEEYHGLIDQIKECQDPHAIFNIHGGNNLIAPTASQAEQKLVEKPADEIKKYGIIKKEDRDAERFRFTIRYHRRFPQVIGWS
ncbi:hypothetical protein PREVCOP_04807 [Segatella copri DSM 18205]|uniref:Transcription-repair coupling factor n=2 Tax=Segatella copri TaxID=165179 RepID=D1PC76_9BACT|nr:hypothetical protein PREVCOP_04807 [Segatella copri DSM 18205]